jgi:hypothetical protein
VTVPVASPRPPMQWRNELAMGVRLSVAGGRTGWARLVLISFGVGIGVAVLLVAATVPTLVAARDARLADRVVDASRSLPAGADTLLVAEARSEYRDRVIIGRLVQPEGDRAPLPPGVTRMPAPGEMVASPALAALLSSADGALLRGRWNERVVGTIGPAGLVGPAEYAFYLGSDRLTEDSAARISSFGNPSPDEGIPEVLLLLAAVGLVVLLVPVAVFLATAVRFGGEARDRQLAALRLVGASAATTRRIAAGETLAGAVLGLVVGGLLFLVAGLLGGRLLPPDMRFHLADFRPVPALAALVVVLVPVAAVLVTVSALRRVVLEPLGVVRRADDRRRRLWWRLVLPATGLALLFPLPAGVVERGEWGVYQAVVGVAALLAGVALLLPWVVEATVRRLGGGGVAWELAVRRLQLDSGAAVRAVSGMAVSVAGAIALQGLLGAVQEQYTAETGGTSNRFQAEVWGGQPDQQGWAAGLAQTPVVRAVGPWVGVTATPIRPGAEPVEVTVGDCDVLRQFGTIDACADGDTFVIGGEFGAPPRPGAAYVLGEPAASEPEWTLPAATRTVPANPADLSAAGGYPRILVTPAALAGTRPESFRNGLYVALDAADPDAVEKLRNAVNRVDPAASVSPIPARPLVGTLLTIRQSVQVGAVALVLVVGASLLVNVVEQLRERRRLLTALVAFGTRRGTLGGSILYQVAVPVVLGLVLAVGTGTGLAAILQTAAGAPVRVDWAGIGAASGTAALVVLLTTAAGLPLLWRLTEHGGLRSE